MTTVSVIIPTYNRLAFLREAVASVVAQTFDDWELIVADDGSTDGTRAYLSELREPRVRVVELEHSGNPARVRNAAIAAACGRWLAFLDSDDAWLPAKLEVQLARLAAASTCGWSCTGIQFVDQGGATIIQPAGPPYRPRSGWILEALITLEATTTTPTLMVLRSLFHQVGGFDETFLHREDRDLSLRLAAASELCALAEPLTLVRHHANRWTSAQRVAELHRYNELAYRKTFASAANRSVRALCTQQCATERIAMARVLSREGEFVAAMRSIAGAIRDDPLAPRVWRAMAGVVARAAVPSAGRS
ncbi:MAG: glycosyltransferase family 2 protein [bacterium]